MLEQSKFFENNVDKMKSTNSKILNNVTNAPNILKTFPPVYNKNTKVFASKVSMRSFKCYKCNKSFPSYLEVVSHLKLIHNACAFEDCSKISNFKMHSSVCVNRGFGCAICNQKFSEKYLLLTHFNEHIDAAFYVCEICREGFQQQKDLQRHLFHVHAETACLPITPALTKSIYQKCSRCSKYFELFAEFEEHVSSCSSSTYACNTCQIIFQTSCALDEHKSAEHKFRHAVKGHAALRQGKRYFCGVCYLGFFKGSILKKHLVTHEMETSYICDVCYENFSSDDDLQSHYLKHIEEHYVLHDLISQYSCKSCMKIFKYQEELKDHLIEQNCKSGDGNTVLSDSIQTSSDNYDNQAPSASAKEIEENNSDASQDFVESLAYAPSEIYALRSGEELSNCDDSECVIIMDHSSLFVLQRGICASENRMPDVKNSEAYNENDVIDASLLQNHMLQVLNVNNANNLVSSEEPPVLLNNEESTSLLQENLNTVIETVEMAPEAVSVNFDNSNDNFVKFDITENNESLFVGGCEGSVNSDNTSEAYEFLIYNTNDELLINNNEQLSASDISIQTKVPSVNQFANSKIINKELLTEHNNKSNVYDLHICNICKQVFSSKTSLCLHVKGSHTGFDCFRCGASFSCDDELKNHEKTFHQSSFNCDLCEVTFSKEHLLRKHKRSAHGGKEFACHLCDKSYVLKNEYEVHMMCHNKETPPTKCEICGKVYASMSNYMRHKAMHEGKSLVKNYECTICNKAFIASIPLKIHLKTHMKKSPSNFECPRCKIYFPLKALAKHIESHDTAS